MEEFGKLGVQVFALSLDSPFSHDQWAKQLDEKGLLKGQQLLSDWNREAAKAFGVLRDDLFGFKPLTARASFLVDREGVVRYAWMTEDPKVLPDPKPVLEAARGLAGG